MPLTTSPIATDLPVKLDAERFYDPCYDAELLGLVTHVLASEAPLAEALLAQRIARAHGFQRTGRIIRERIMAVAGTAHLVEQEEGGRRFVWIDADQRVKWDHARFPATREDIHQIEDIPLAEHRVAKCGRDTVDVARAFDVRRQSNAARARINSV